MSTNELQSIADTETMQGIADRIRDGLANGTLACAPDRFECRYCFNSGFREIADPQRQSNYRGVVRCDYCEYWSFRRQRLAA